MVGVTYRNNSCRPASQKGQMFVPPIQIEQEEEAAKVTPPSFRDKESYQELFKPLPKPEALPPLIPFKVDVKSYHQLQKEREEMMNKEIEKTRQEAVSLWDRAKQDDNKRVDLIMTEKRRVEMEQKMRNEILQKENEERLAKDKARKEEIRRQEELLSGRKIRAKTTDIQADYVNPGGIQVYHYKDPVVQKIVNHTQKEDIRRRMSHGEVLRLPQEESNHEPEAGNLMAGAGSNGVVNFPKQSFMADKNITQTGSNGHVNNLKQSFMADKNITPIKQSFKFDENNSREVFKSNVMLRSQSSASSTTSR